MNLNIINLLFFCLLNGNNRYCLGAGNGAESKSDTKSITKIDVNFCKYGENPDKTIHTFIFLENPQFITDISNIVAFGNNHANYDWLKSVSKMAEWNLRQARKLSIQYSDVTEATLKKWETMEFDDVSEDTKK